MSRPEARAPRASGRLLGLDLFRAVAVFGMLVAHVGPAAWTPGEGFGTVHVEWEIFHSRMPAMFAFAAGLSLNLGRAHASGAAQPAVVPTLIRAALLAACGFALTWLGTPVVVILTSFAVWFVLVLPLRRLGAPALLIVAGAWAVLGPAASFLLRRSITLPGNALWDALVAGDYPAMTWMPFVVAGLGVGRLELSSKRIRLRLAAAGAALIGIGYLLSGLLLSGGLTARILDTLPAGADGDAAQQFARRFFAESGVTDTGSWLWLLVPAPHSGSWADVLGCLGVCLLLLAVLLPIGELSRWAENGRPAGQRAVGLLVTLAAPLGTMVLSVYAAHIVAMAVITAATGHSFSGAQSPLMLLGFTLGLMLFSVLWLRRFPRGPLEWLLGRATAVIERMGRRASAGSTRPSRP
ncbi:DUF418 domain-containing protein [Leucobacter massiliensis]|uniref:DUF418 domain-containing protein n=1 Tax=Leucobacter massiliensis TaxID=1686285 RepID=A0A2S9QPV5_9MICO|nr:DUF418 domain-containing protein [Leucobacter massiliensis]PRI11616.1 hypothetical protein B4915_05785 [Leucobacter massiliensis]